MHTRTLMLVLGGLLVGVIALALGGVALANAMGPRAVGSYPAASGSTPGAYGPGGMMGGQYPGGMMGGQYPGGMMGGYGQTATPSGTATSGVTKVTIQNLAFQPANIEVPAGTTVTWTNEDTAPHTVTFRSGTAGSGTLQRGQTFRFTFTTPGTYDYYCAVHPNMVARVTVTS